MYYRGYQKLTHILLCDDDQGQNEGRGRPVKKVPYKDCEMLECTDIKDIHDRLIFEGDRVRVTQGIVTFTGSVGTVPDMFRSRRLHPMHDLLESNHIPDDSSDLQFEILGNIYETPYLAPRKNLIIQAPSL